MPRDFIGQGVANAVAGVFLGSPVGGSSRTGQATGEPAEELRYAWRAGFTG